MSAKPAKVIEPSAVETTDNDIDGELYARHAEIESLADLEKQRGTPIPALFNSFYKFVQNPSTVSPETYKRMIDTDPVVGAGVDFLTSAMAARIDEYQHPSKEVTEHVNKALKGVEGGWHNAIKEVASAPWAGFSVTEKVWGNDSDLGFVPKRLVTLPPSTVLFEVDRPGNLTEDGILQYQRNYNPLLGSSLGFFGGMSFGFTGAGGRPDAFAKFGDLPYPMRSPNLYNYLSIRIPRQKVIHYPFASAGRFGNPYGRSLLRRCYKFWVMKDAFLRMLSIALDRKGTPLTCFFVDPNMPLKDGRGLTDPQGPNARGDASKRIDPILAMKEATANIHNDTVLILPGKKGQSIDVEFGTSDANADVFISSVQMCDAQMTRGLLIPALIFTNGDGTGSNALGESHMETWEKILDSWVEGLMNVLIEQLVREIIAYNFPTSAWKKDGLGSFSRRKLTQDERDKEANILQTGITMGAIDMTELQDLNKVRETIGFEPRDKIIPPKNPDMTPGQEPDEFDVSEQQKPKPTKARAKKKKTEVHA